MNKIILVVESDLDLRSNLKQILAHNGFIVLLAENGLEGYNIASKQLPDLILADIHIPLVDGFNLLKNLKENPETSSIPFIFLTGKLETEKIKIGLALGADDYIYNPFSMNELLDTIRCVQEKQSYLNKSFF
ncbi:MAG: response regulator transcription factor [Syntrophothermus sp.]